MASADSYDITDDELLAIALEAEDLDSSNNHHTPTTTTSQISSAGSVDITDDELLAIALEFENLDSSNNHHTTTTTTSHNHKRPRLDSRTTLSLVDPEWEVIDPTPDIRALHVEFDDRFFQGRLRCVEVRWSKRMTLCAGLCSYEGRGGLCSIRLSEPLLRLRPRKDLVETLLHEEIHAYLFVSGGDRDHDAHGPHFLEHMYRINRAAGISPVLSTCLASYLLSTYSVQ